MLVVIDVHSLLSVEVNQSRLPQNGRRKAVRACSPDRDSQKILCIGLELLNSAFLRAVRFTDKSKHLVEWFSKTAFSVRTSDNLHKVLLVESYVVSRIAYFSPKTVVILLPCRIYHFLDDHG